MPITAPAPILNGSRLREARKKAGLTQQQLADAVGVDRKSIGNYETGATQPTSANVQRLADAVNVSLQWVTSTSGVGASDPIRPGYATEAQRRAEAGRPDPRDAPKPEPLAPPGVVLALIIEDSDGQPVWGYEPSGRVVQLGRAMRARASASVSSAPPVEAA